MTTISDVHVSKLRFSNPAYNNLKEWMCNPNNIYIGRKCIVFIDGKRYPHVDSIWCNPFKITNNKTQKYKTVNIFTEMTRNECIQKYKNYIIEKIKKENLHDELIKLKIKF